MSIALLLAGLRGQGSILLIAPCMSPGATSGFIAGTRKPSIRIIRSVPGFLSRRILIQAAVAVTYLALMVAYITLLFMHLH